MAQTPEVAGLRKQYPGYDDIPDDQFVDSIKEAYYKDMPENEYLESLQAAYAPKKGIAASIGGALKETGSELKKDVKAAVSVPQLPFKAAGAALLGNVNLPDIGYEDLIKRGYTPEVAQNVMKQRISTQQSLSSEAEQAAAAGAETAGRGAGALISVGTGAGAEAVATKMLEKTAVAKGLGWIAKHSAGGAAGVGPYMGAKAASEGRPASEIFDEILKGAGIGAIAGPILGKTLGQAGATVGAVLNIPRYVVEGMNAAAVKQRQALMTAAGEFADKFSTGWLKSRFADMFDPTMDPHILATTIMVRVLGKDIAELAPTEAIDKLAAKVKMAQDLSGIDPTFRPTVPQPTEPVQPLLGLEGNAPARTTLPPTAGEHLQGAVAGAEMNQAATAPTIAPGGVTPEPNQIDMGPMVSKETPQMAPPPNPMEVPPSGVEQPLQLEPTAPPVSTPEMQPDLGTAPSPGSPATFLNRPIGSDPPPGELLEHRNVELPPSAETPRVGLPNEMNIKNPTKKLDAAFEAALKHPEFSHTEVITQGGKKMLTAFRHNPASAKGKDYLASTELPDVEGLYNEFQTIKDKVDPTLAAKLEKILEKVAAQAAKEK